MRAAAAALLLALFLSTAAVVDRAPEEGPVQLALVSDTHTTRGTQQDEPLYKGRLDRVMTAVNAAGVDAVLIAGDLTQSGKPEEMADFQAQVRGFRAPVWVVAGNHDVGGKRIPGKEGGVTAARVTAFEQVFGPSFFARQCRGVRVVGVNASLFGSALPREAEQWAFLDRELAMPAAIPTLLFMHYPPFVEQPDEPGGGYWNIEPGPRTRLLALMARGGVRALLSGHLHRPLQRRRDRVLYVTTPPVSFGLPRGKQAQGWTLITITGAGELQAEFREITD
jgi:3',5'-cyclic AMP phosphodiesterase CpdA